MAALGLSILKNDYRGRFYGVAHTHFAVLTGGMTAVAARSSSSGRRKSPRKPHGATHEGQTLSAPDAIASEVKVPAVLPELGEEAHVRPRDARPVLPLRGVAPYHVEPLRDERLQLGFRVSPVGVEEAVENPDGVDVLLTFKLARRPIASYRVVPHVVSADITLGVANDAIPKRSDITAIQVEKLGVIAIASQKIEKILYGCAMPARLSERPRGYCRHFVNPELSPLRLRPANATEKVCGKIVRLQTKKALQTRPAETYLSSLDID